MSNGIAVISLSGGMDSTILLYTLLKDVSIKEIYVVSLDYNQRHKKELESAKNIVKYIQVNEFEGSKIKDHKILNLDLRQFNHDSVLVSDNDVPLQSELKQGKTVVPYRNMLFTLLVASQAKSVGASEIYLGPVRQDHLSYPDCRKEFFDSLQQSLRLSGEDEELVIRTPFIYRDKKDLVKLGIELGVPFSVTWTCYVGKERPCLECDACLEKTQSFYENNIQDPTLSEKEWKRAVEVYKKSNLVTV